jgi:UDP-N-acetylmuramoyl-tripeptide--D-alanyl-D-alanine ligase
MILWTGIELNRIFSANLAEEICITGISIDTRTLKPGDLFVALKGENGDGHTFLAQAEQKGAVAALVSRRDPFLAIPQIVVQDTLQGLRELAQAARQRTKAHVIAITGSVGKTSTKEILAQVLSCFGKVSYAQASYNNHWGVPLSLALIKPDAQFAILEIGMNNPGEIAPLSQLVRPHIGVITNIAPAHIGHMGSLDAIAAEKSHIFDGLEAPAIAIVPTDDIQEDKNFYQFFKAKAHNQGAQRIISFGKEATAEFRLKTYQQNSSGTGAALDIEVGKKHFQYQWPLVGEHLANIALIVHAVAEVLNLKQDEVCQALTKVHPIKGRGIHHHILVKGQQIYLIDDAYNANLTSMLAGLKVLKTIKPQKKGRRIAVLGEMLELGDFALDHHQRIAQFLDNSEIDQVFLTGGIAMLHCYNTLPEHLRGGYTQQVQELVPLVMNYLRPHDVVFVKGSKGSRVSVVVEALLAQSQVITENVA